MDKGIIASSVVWKTIGVRPHGGLKVSRVCGASHEEIARCAYDIYERSGFVPGQCRRNWEQAERRLRQ